MTRPPPTTPPQDGRRSAVGRPSSRDVGIMAVAVGAIATSAPLIAATAAPALAIGFWRNALAVVAIAPFALGRRRSRAELFGLTRRELRLALAAGGLLALHFATWLPSLTYTSVASSTALVATQPVWAAVIARATGQLVPGRAWVGMAVAFVGVLLITGIDLTLSGRAVFGDLLALAGGFFSAAYVTVGSRVRATVSTTTYTFVCYATCAVLMLVPCLLGGQQLLGYSATTWWQLVALTLGAQLLGHSLINLVLQTTSPTVVSLAILFEMPGAALIAALWLGQRPPWGLVPAALLLLAGVAMVVRSSGAEAGTPGGLVEAPPG